MDGGDGCATLWQYLMAYNCTSKSGWNNKFCYTCFITMTNKFLKIQMLRLYLGSEEYHSKTAKTSNW